MSAGDVVAATQMAGWGQITVVNNAALHRVASENASLE
jgi:hypothetical protein